MSKLDKLIKENQSLKEKNLKSIKKYSRLFEIDKLINKKKYPNKKYKNLKKFIQNKKSNIDRLNYINIMLNKIGGKKEFINELVESINTSLDTNSFPLEQYNDMHTLTKLQYLIDKFIINFSLPKFKFSYNELTFHQEVKKNNEVKNYMDFNFDYHSFVPSFLFNYMPNIIEIGDKIEFTCDELRDNKFIFKHLFQRIREYKTKNDQINVSSTTNQPPPRIFDEVMRFEDYDDDDFDIYGDFGYLVENTEFFNFNKEKDYLEDKKKKTIVFTSND